MPYIVADYRKELQGGDRPKSSGELNYCFTHKVLEYLPQHPSYSDFNAAIGALECAKLELYRRMVVPYEEQKREQNGDVY